MRTAFLVLVLMAVTQIPASSQEAKVVGLKGPVHSVLTEEFTSEGGTRPEPSGSVLEIFDRQGYQLEVYRYKPDGSLWVHTVFDRKGPLVSRTQTTGVAPFESGSTQNFFDTQGRLIGMDTYDVNGALVSRSRGEFMEQQPDSTIYRRTETKADGSESTAESTETTDPETGLTHQIEIRDGKPEADWVIQRNKDGTLEKDKIVYKDGSFNERERKADGTTVEDRYFAPTNSHTYQKSDTHGHLIEVLEKSDSHYIRCTYSFDESGRPTGQINYDADANILDKSTTEYRDDSHGNWIEKKSTVWDTKTEPLQPKIVATTLRTINYY